MKEKRRGGGGVLESDIGRTGDDEVINDGQNVWKSILVFQRETSLLASMSSLMVIAK
jgi:hypothetical protein